MLSFIQQLNPVYVKNTDMVKRDILQYFPDVIIVNMIKNHTHIILL